MHFDKICYHLKTWFYNQYTVSYDSLSCVLTDKIPDQELAMNAASLSYDQKEMFREPMKPPSLIEQYYCNCWAFSLQLIFALLKKIGWHWATGKFYYYISFIKRTLNYQTYHCTPTRTFLPSSLTFNILMSDVHNLHGSQRLLKDVRIVCSRDCLSTVRNEAVIFEVLEEQFSCRSK